MSRGSGSGSSSSSRRCRRRRSGCSRRGGRGSRQSTTRDVRQDLTKVQQPFEHLDEIDVTIYRLGSDSTHEGPVHFGRHADREYLDAGVFRGRRFRHGQVGVEVGRTVGDQKQDLRDTGSGAVFRREHLLTGLFQGGGDVGVAACDVEEPHGGDHRRGVVVVVEVEPDLDHVAELEHADLRGVAADLEQAGDLDGERQHVSEPVVVVVGNDARRLVQHQDDVGFLTTHGVVVYITPTQTSRSVLVQVQTR